MKEFSERFDHKKWSRFNWFIYFSANFPHIELKLQPCIIGHPCFCISRYVPNTLCGWIQQSKMKILYDPIEKNFFETIVPMIFQECKMGEKGWKIKESYSCVSRHIKSNEVFIILFLLNETICLQTLESMGYFW